ncbi:MAG: Hpt domain-containing protein [Rhodocyclaceae bacterium]|nr:Hpt domain-containing protein [Rhodocyclaceae bacterium]
MSAAPFDRSVLIDGLGGDLELYAEIVQLFLGHYPGELDILRAALASGDAVKLHRTAHSLKGAISNFSAPRATEAARALEFAAKGGMSDNAAHLVDELIIAVEALGQAMRADISPQS